MNLKEEERRARLLKSRAERLPGIKRQFEEAQGRKTVKTATNGSGASIDEFEMAQNRNFNSNFAPGGKDANLVGSKASRGKNSSKGVKKASKGKTATKTTKSTTKSQAKTDAEQRKVNLSVSTKKGDMVHHTAFGRGMVLSVLKMGGDALLEIAFDEIGTKKLMAKSPQTIQMRIEQNP